MGVLTASTATGQLVFLPSLASAVTSEGWRAAPMIVALATVAVMPVIWFFMRDDPRDLGLRPYGESGAPEATFFCQMSTSIAASFGLLALFGHDESSAAARE